MFERRSEFEKLPILRAFCSALGGEVFGTFCRYKKYRYVKSTVARGRSPTETFGDNNLYNKTAPYLPKIKPRSCERGFIHSNLN